MSNELAGVNWVLVLGVAASLFVYLLVSWRLVGPKPPTPDPISDARANPPGLPFSSRIAYGLTMAATSLVIVGALALLQHDRSTHNASGAIVLGLLFSVLPSGGTAVIAVRWQSPAYATRAVVMCLGIVACSVALFALGA